jgi:acylphosphatase
LNVSSEGVIFMGLLAFVLRVGIMSMKHYSIRVSGRVQGVFYRASAAEKARELGLKGYVCNQPDGSVFIEAEGNEEALKKLIEWTAIGPPRAKVEACEVTEGSLKNYSEFSVQR